MKIINRNKETIMGKYDYPIDHIFFLNNNTYVVKRSNLNCPFCAFSSMSKECIEHRCGSSRADGIEIIFEALNIRS